jgi:hypothetical protein
MIYKKNLYHRFFLWLVPIGDIMLTKDVYHIQVKNRKTTGVYRWLFYVPFL